jgi:DnaJ domain
MAGTRTRDWADVDFYAILGIPPHASDEEVARAYRTLAKQLHPDAGAVPADIERFKNVSAAYEVLGDARMRRDYDFVRQQMRFRPAPRPVGMRPAPSRVGAFRAPARKPPRGWTVGRAWLAIVSGIAVTLLGVVVGVIVWDLRVHSGDPGVVPDPARDVTLAIVSLKLLISGPVFVVLGARHRHDVPPRPRVTTSRPSVAHSGHALTKR